MPPRFHVPEASVENSLVELPDDEAAHLTRVLRLDIGAGVRVFNGRGDEWDARVHTISKHHVSVRLESHVAASPEPRLGITLAIAVLKGDKMDAIVRDAVMLGVRAIVPMITMRTETSRAAIDRSHRVVRWQRIAVSSAKQCGRAVVPEVHEAAVFDAVIAHVTNAVMLVEPAAAANTMTLRDLELPVGAELTLVVGPEGGWTDEEVQRARQSGAMLMTLGAQTLRADAVPIVALTAVRVQLEDF